MAVLGPKWPFLSEQAVSPVVSSIEDKGKQDKDNKVEVNQRNKMNDKCNSAKSPQTKQILANPEFFWHKQ